MVATSILVFCIAIGCGCLILLLFFLPFIIAEKFRLTNSFGLDVVISYLFAWFFNVIGILIYILLSILINKEKKT